MSNVRMYHQSRFLTPSTCPAVPLPGCYQVLSLRARPPTGTARPWCFSEEYVIVRGKAIRQPSALSIPESLKDEVKALFLARGRRAGMDVPRHVAHLTEPPPHCWKIRTLAPESQVPPQSISYKRSDDY